MGNIEVDVIDEVFPRPDASRVLRRALALSAVVCRGFMENQQDRSYAVGLHGRVIAWMERAGIRDELETDELAMVLASIGTLDRQQTANATWRSEGLAVLAWALGKFPLPRHDDTVVPVEAAESVGFLDDSSAEQAALRPESEIDVMEQHLLALHWRLRDFRLRPDAMDFVEFVRNCRWAVLSVDPEALVEGDLAIDGVRIDRADPERVQECSSIAQERHQAINWLIGDNPIYSQVETNT